MLFCFFDALVFERDAESDWLEIAETQNNCAEKDQTRSLTIEQLKSMGYFWQLFRRFAVYCTVLIFFLTGFPFLILCHKPILISNNYKSLIQMTFIWIDPSVWSFVWVEFALSKSVPC